MFVTAQVERSWLEKYEDYRFPFFTFTLKGKLIPSNYMNLLTHFHVADSWYHLYIIYVLIYLCSV